MNDGGVIAIPELACDRGVGEIGELPEDVHTDLPRRDQWTSTTRSYEIVDSEAEGLRRRVEDHFFRDSPRLFGVNDVRKNALCQIISDILPIETSVRDHSDESTLELPDIVGHIGGDELENVLRNGDSLAFDLLPEDGETRFQLGWLHIGDQAGQKPTPETIFQWCDRVRGAIRREDHLL